MVGQSTATHTHDVVPTGPYPMAVGRDQDAVPAPHRRVQPLEGNGKLRHHLVFNRQPGAWSYGVAFAEIHGQVGTATRDVPREVTARGTGSNHSDPLHNRSRTSVWARFAAWSGVVPVKVRRNDGCGAAKADPAETRKPSVSSFVTASCSSAPSGNENSRFGPSTAPGRRAGASSPIVHRNASRESMTCRTFTRNRCSCPSLARNRAHARCQIGGGAAPAIPGTASEKYASLRTKPSRAPTPASL